MRERSVHEGDPKPRFRRKLERPHGEVSDDVGVTNDDFERILRLKPGKSERWRGELGKRWKRIKSLTVKIEGGTSEKKYGTQGEGAGTRE